MSFKLYAYYALLVLVNILSFARRRHFSLPERLIAALMLLTLLAELLALYGVFKWKNAFPVYHFYNPAQFLVISLYFNQSIAYFRKRSIGLITGISGVFLGVLNTLFLQDIRTTNSFFLLFEGTVVMIYCLVALHQILLEEENLPYRFTLFWITVCLLIYWSITFTQWGFLALMERNDPDLYAIFNMLLTIANFTFYPGVGLTLLYSHKLIPSDRG